MRQGREAHERDDDRDRSDTKPLVPFPRAVIGPAVLDVHFEELPGSVVGTHQVPTIYRDPVQLRLDGIDRITRPLSCASDDG